MVRSNLLVISMLFLMDRANRAAVGINTDYTLYSLVVVLISGKVEGDVDALNYEYLTLGLYLPGGISVEVVEGNVTRCQRASEGPEQSAAGRRDQVVERAGMGLFNIGRDTV